MAWSRSSRGRRADYRWTLGQFSALGQASNTAAQSVIVTAGTTSQTIMRVRGSWACQLDLASADGDAAFIGIGFLVQQAGATATSLPNTDGDAPFFFYETVPLIVEDASLSIDRGLSSFRGVIDGKAMCVLRPDQEVIAIAEMSNVSGAPSWNVMASARFLIAD